MRESIATLERRSYQTYQYRLRASKRLSFRHNAWNASLIATSSATTIASAALLVEPEIYGEGGPFLLVAVAVLSLTTSLVASSLDYSARSRNMFTNYRRIQRLSGEAERLKRAVRIDPAEVSRLWSDYDALLDESENHTESDYFAVERGRRKPVSVYRENVISVLPYLSLAVPLLLALPIASWLL